MSDLRGLLGLAAILALTFRPSKSFIALIAMANGLLRGVGEWFGYDGLTFQRVLGWFFSPVAWGRRTVRPQSAARRLAGQPGQRLDRRSGGDLSDSESRAR